MASVSDPLVQQLLKGRYVATLATGSPDGSIHMVAVWFWFDGAKIYVTTSSRSRKARNLQARSRVSLMVDQRTPGQERGVTVTGTAELIQGTQSQALNRKIHARYMSAEALADPKVTALFGAMDDVTLRVTPATWIGWNMAELDAQLLQGTFAAHPGYMLPLD